MSDPSIPSMRVRIYFGPAIGPGKADLLEAIAETGSISAAGRRLGMNFRQAWALVDSMNRHFREQVVTTTKGGSHGGGAVLTAFGTEVLHRYRAMQVQAEKAVESDFADFRQLIGKKRLDLPAD
jgi:molybdate transport system regulatory protein